MIEKKSNNTENSETRYANFTELGVTIPPRPESIIPVENPTNRLSLAEYTLPGLKLQVRNIINSAISEANIKLDVMDAPDSIDADIAIPTFPLARIYKTSPFALAEQEAEKLSKQNLSSLILRVKAEKGYINLELDPNAFAGNVLTEIEQLQDHYGETDSGKGKTVVIDCSAPNIAKYMSVGHLRSTVIGESLARIHKKIGYTVIRDNHLGDWGTQFGMLGAAFERWGNEDADISGDTNQVRGLYNLYVRIHNEIETEKNEIIAKRIEAGEDPAKIDGIETTLERAGREWFQRLESGDKEAEQLWRWSLDLSMQEFQRVYNLLGSKFEYALGESSYLEMLPSVVNSFVSQGIAEKSNGATSVHLDESFGKNQKGEGIRLVIQKSDGTSLYSTRDLATLIARTEWFNPDEILYVVGGDQKDYFKQVFAAFKQLGKGNVPATEHIPFGMISMADGKMSTRKGRVIFLEDVLSEAMERAKAKTSPSLSEDERNEISKIVGVGSVIYFDLHQGRERDIKFNIDEALSLEGNSAPYIQYAFTRAFSILNKAAENQISVNTEIPVQLEEPSERKLIKHLSKFPELILEARTGYRPHVIADYAYQTAELFNSFYKQVRVLSESDENKLHSRLRLTAAAGQVIKNALDLLGIQVPTKM